MCIRDSGYLVQAADCVFGVSREEEVVVHHIVAGKDVYKRQGSGFGLDSKPRSGDSLPPRSIYH